MTPHLFCKNTPTPIAKGVGIWRTEPAAILCWAEANFIRVLLSERIIANFYLVRSVYSHSKLIALRLYLQPLGSDIHSFFLKEYLFFF